MRAMAAVVVLQAALMGAGASVEVPPWLYAAGSLVGSGVFLRYYMARVEKRVQEATARRTDVDTRRLEEEIQSSILARSRTAMAEMETELEKVRGRLSDALKELADVRRQFTEQVTERDRRLGIMRHEIERLHDQVAAYRAGDDTGKRRGDPD